MKYKVERREWYSQDGDSIASGLLLVVRIDLAISVEKSCVDGTWEAGAIWWDSQNGCSAGEAMAFADRLHFAAEVCRALDQNQDLEEVEV